jgi:hypothetical protein
MGRKSVGSILWQSEKDNEVQQVEVESYLTCTKLKKNVFYQKTCKNDLTLKNISPNTQSNTYRNIPQETQEP